MKSSWENPLLMAARCLRGLPSPLSLLPLKPSPSSSRSFSLAPSQPASSKLLSGTFHDQFVTLSFLFRSDSQPFCTSGFLWLFTGYSFRGRRRLKAMTCDFQEGGEQHSLSLGAGPFRAFVSIKGTSPRYLFTLGRPSMSPPGLMPSKFPFLAMAQKSFSLDLGTLHCLFLNQPAAPGPKL